jgi:hypothetical protein
MYHFRLVVGATVSLYQLRNLLPGSRSRLKADLEILELPGKDHRLYQSVKSQTDEQFRRIYSQAPTGQDNRPIVYNWRGTSGQRGDQAVVVDSVERLDGRDD